MSKPIIEVKDICKRYQLGAIGTTRLRDDVEHFWHRLTGRAGKVDEKEFWALRDVSFEVQPGEIVGIMGRNGAGKSTLLKILSRITEPTSGEIIMRGRVASLLEVGTGFHGDLTGRENVFLNGAILGMTKAEIRGKLDEIIAFAEIEKFIDTPVKRYSSGMYVRLAFAVAAHMEPEILIIDEVLAVGDVQFQKKCIGKMGQVSQGGRTVLFVSHNLAVVSSLCSRAILLSNGRTLVAGPTEEVVAAYIETHDSGSAEVRWDASDPAAGNGRLRLSAARVASLGRMTAAPEIDQPVTLECDFEVLLERANICSSIHLFDRQGTCAFVSGTATKPISRGSYRHSYTIPANLLNDGLYSASIILLTDTSHFEVHVRNAISFTVHESKRAGEYLGTVIGCVRPPLKVEERQLSN